MAAPMDSVSESSMEDQSKEISSSCGRIEPACQEVAYTHDGQKENAENGASEELIPPPSTGFSTSEAAADAMGTERSATTTPPEKAAVSSTSSDLTSSGATSRLQTSATETESCTPKGINETSPTFKVPALGVQLSKSKSNSKMKLQNSAGSNAAQKMPSLSNTNSGLENKTEEGTVQTSENVLPPSTRDISPSTSSSSTFAFVMPSTKSLPKTKHKSFDGNQSQSGPQPQDLETKSESTSSDSEKKKLSQEKEKLKASAPPLPYKEPSWSGIPPQAFHLEVLKNGTILSKVPLNDKPFHVFGRLEACDVQMDHPSLSRYHLVLQYRLTGDGDHDPGFYVYDLGSTHGSFMNKQKLNAKTYYRMKVGHMFKMGGSTRLFILQGPAEDQEPESELSVTELKELRQQQMMQMEEKKRKQAEKEEELKTALQEKPAGIDWGMGMDADEEEDEEDPGADNPFAMQTQEEREAAYIKDPKKTLRGFFEREDVELEYEVDEKGAGYNHQYVCRVQLPIDDSMGNPLYAEATVSGKKKEAVVACALEACRILDAHGVLRQATHESKKRKAKDWAQDDYYDSDDDTFLDRTGAVEKKRKQRMVKAGVVKEKAETFDSLTTKLKEVEAELEVTEKQLEAAKKAQPASGDPDSLDDFIASLKAGGGSHDRAQRARLKLRCVELRKEQFRLGRLIQVAHPAAIPEPLKTRPTSKQGALPMIGSMKSKSNFKDRFKPKIQINTIKLKTETDDQVEEEEEDDIEDEKGSPCTAVNRAEPASEDMETDTHDNVKQLETHEEPPVHKPARGPQLPADWQATKIDQAQPNEEEEGEEEEQGVVGTSQSTPAASKPQRVYGPAMPPPMPPSQAGGGGKKGEQVEEDAVSVTTSKRVYGPARPPPADGPERGMRGPSGAPSTAVSRQHAGIGRMMGHLGVAAATSERDQEGAEMREEGPEYSAWQPPSDQKGDGRTKLNEKLGY